MIAYEMGVHISMFMFLQNILIFFIANSFIWQDIIWQRKKTRILNAAIEYILSTERF